MIVDYTQIGVRPFHLQLERESAAYWIVTDRWNPDTVMMRSADADLCRRFMAAFVAKEPGASADLYSWRVAQAQTLSEREQPSPLPGRTGSRSENVYPLFHEQIDEAS